MNRLFVITSTLILLGSCSNPKKGAKKENILEEKPKIENSSKDDNSIIGLWGNDEVGNAMFAFYPDSIYYPDPNLTYKYDLIEDTIVIYKEDNYVEKIKIIGITKDSLYLHFIDYEVDGSFEKRK